MPVNRTYIILLFILCNLGYSQNQDKSKSDFKYKKILVYENRFSTPESLNDWIMEGPGKAYWAKGKVTLIPDAQKEIEEKWESSGKRNLNVKKEYYATIKSKIEKSHPEMIDKLVNPKGDFVGGHIVFWNKAVMTESNFIVEFDFKPLSPIGLGIVFFSASGISGEDIFSSDLTPRFGVFESYTKGDINCYHISYWANWAPFPRQTCNMRKNFGFYCLANGTDYTSKSISCMNGGFSPRKFKIRIEKINNNIKFYIDGKLSINFTDLQVNNIIDDDGNLVKENVNTGGVYGKGRVGLRHMADLKAEYSNFKVYKILMD